MKLLHVVSLVDPEGSFGGPLRVAVNQARALMDEGHEVLIAAGASGYGSRVPGHFDGIPLRGFAARQVVPGSGFAGLAAPGLLRWLRANARNFDAVHVHLARDLVSLPAAAVVAAQRVPYVVQTHGMIDASDKKLADVLDALLTRRILRAASTVFALTSREVADLETVAPGLDHVAVLSNGVPTTSTCARPDASNDVLFLARMAERKRPLDFVEAARSLAAVFPDATFSLVGPDEGMAARVCDDLVRGGDAGGAIRYEGPLPPHATSSRMAESAIYVLPAVDEPFGMTVVEAMAVGLPTVVMSDCGLADAVAETGGVVAEPGRLAAAIGELLGDPERRARAGEAGRQYVEREASMRSIAMSLVTAYTAAGATEA